MAEFQSCNEYRIFADFVKHKARYVLDERSKRFLQVVLDTSEKRKMLLPQRSQLWRAQLTHDLRTVLVPPFMQEDLRGVTEYLAPHPCSGQRMLPFLDRATEGRVNPKGIPCMYFAMDGKTSMSEVRPQIANYVSVAEFTTVKALQLVDCSSDELQHSVNYYAASMEPSADERECCVWEHMNVAFSDPVTRSDIITLRTMPLHRCLLKRFETVVTTGSFTRADLEKTVRTLRCSASIVRSLFLAAYIKSMKSSLSSRPLCTDGPFQSWLGLISNRHLIRFASISPERVASCCRRQSGVVGANLPTFG
jgi:hypothetical protein